MKRLKPATSHCKKPAWIVEDNLLVWNQGAARRVWQGQAIRQDRPTRITESVLILKSRSEIGEQLFVKIRPEEAPSHVFVSPIEQRSV